MSDRMIAERLQPSLLDRLTDDDPFEVKESRNSRVIAPGACTSAARTGLR